MNNDETKVVPTPEGQREDLFSAMNEIEKIKASSVDKAEYDRLLEEHQKLFKTMITREVPNVQEKKEKVDIQALRNELYSGDTLTSGSMTNLEYISKTLQLRDALIAEGHGDPMLPRGYNVSIDDADIAKANRVADVLRDCIEQSDGDNGVFTSKLQTKLNDLPIRKK